MVRFSAHLSMLFTEHAALDRPAAAARAGFTLVESWWPPADDVDAWADAVRAAGVGVSCLNADGGDIAAGDRGFCNLPERDADTLAAVTAALALAARVGAPCVNVLPGRVVPDRPVADQRRHAATVYRTLGDLAHARGLTIVVEPINATDVPDYLLPTPVAVADFLDTVDHPSVRMLFDAYHCARAGRDPAAEVAAHVGRIGHVQYADHPGRGAPGTGRIDLSAFVRALERAGYDGPIGMEYAPGGPTGATLGWLADAWPA
jgi:hydroxypyruvate isomerase